MDLTKISKDINSQLSSYDIGKIQHFRKTAKNLNRPKSYKLFPDETINENWTFHIGGRAELQFNIGNEDNKKNGRIFFQKIAFIDEKV